MPKIIAVEQKGKTVILTCVNRWSHIGGRVVATTIHPDNGVGTGGTNNRRFDGVLRVRVLCHAQREGSRSGDQST